MTSAVVTKVETTDLTMAIPRRSRKLLAKCALFSALCVIILGVFNIALAMVEELRQRVVELQDRTQVLTRRRVHRSDKNDVIISSYMNSGSTFTAGLLGMRSDAFYVYEPLWHLFPWDYYRTSSTVCSLKALECRTLTQEDMNKNTPASGMPVEFEILQDHDIKQMTSPVAIPKRILEHIYNCNMKKLHNIIRPEVTVELSGSSWNRYRRCISRKYPKEECLNGLDLKCLGANHRVSKVLRLTTGAYDELLSKFPRLKVIHLFRDPRAIINSRIETNGYPLSASRQDLVKANAKILCDKMAVDWSEGRSLQMKFPTRFKFIHYEDIYSNESSLVTLHNDLGMSLTRGDLYRSKLGNKNKAADPNQEQVTLRQENNAYWWRDNMAFDTVAIVDNACRHVYDRLGYPHIRDSNHLRKYSVSKEIQKLKFLL